MLKSLTSFAFVTLNLIPGAHLTAQRQLPVERGDRVRVTARTLHADELVGTLVGCSAVAGAAARLQVHHLADARHGDSAGLRGPARSPERIFSNAASRSRGLCPTKPSDRIG